MHLCGKTDCGEESLSTLGDSTREEGDGEDLAIVSFGIAPRELVTKFFGVSDGGRTRDNPDHNRVLYQLSYAHHSSFARLPHQRLFIN